MTLRLDDKAPLKEGEIEETPQADTRKCERRHKFRKAIMFLGLTLLLLALWPFRIGCHSQSVQKVMDDWGSRKRRIDTGSQAIAGDFDLYDLLSIRSYSGSISIGVHPQPADEENPVPAELLINSYSGKVSVDFPAFSAPERDYRISIDSKHGAVGGNVLHGHMTSVVSQSARIEMQFTPYATGDYSSTLRTASQSGAQHITVTSPVKDIGKAITHMSSVHSTMSASLGLWYPREWEGTIEGHTGSGSLNLHGGNLDIIRRGSYHNSGHYILAKKGNGNSTLTFHTGSGSADIYFD